MINHLKRSCLLDRRTFYADAPFDTANPPRRCRLINIDSPAAGRSD